MQFPIFSAQNGFSSVWVGWKEQIWPMTDNHLVNKEIDAAWGINFLSVFNIDWASSDCFEKGDLVLLSKYYCIYLLQKHIVRLIAKADYLTNTAPLFCQLRLLDIFSINSFSIAIFMYLLEVKIIFRLFYFLVSLLFSNQVNLSQLRSIFFSN